MLLQNALFANYDAAHMHVKARRSRLVQRVHRPYAASSNEDPVLIAEAETLFYSKKLNHAINLLRTTCTSTLFKI
jgi:hypothetical protein